MAPDDRNDWKLGWGSMSHGHHLGRIGGLGDKGPSLLYLVLALIRIRRCFVYHYLRLRSPVLNLNLCYHIISYIAASISACISTSQLDRPP